MNDIWTIQAALDWTAGYLERKGDENPRLSAQWLLSEATGLSRIELYTRFEQPLSMEERDVLRGYVSRRGAGEPLQYITGEVGFRHIAVKVRTGVLIPRPETEVLVSEGLAALPAPRKRIAADAFASDAKATGQRAAADEPGFELESASEAASAFSFESEPKLGLEPAVEFEPASELEPKLEAELMSELESKPRSGFDASPSRGLLVADLCTGSGCIACSIAYEHPETRVIATDLAPEAVSLARENAEALGLSDRVEVLECSLGEAVPKELLGSFDLVISNPPYIPTAVLAELPSEVSDFEPALALDGGDDGFDLFRPLAVWAASALRSGGALAVELHETCLDEAAEIARDAGFERMKIVEDLAGRPRVLVARTPGERGKEQ